MPPNAGRYIAVLAFAVAACEPTGKPTILPFPTGALEVKQVDFMEGRAHQTDFTLKVRFPDTPALAHYSKVIPAPWVQCDWSGPEWQSFLDGTVTPLRTVHQQLHMWVNRSARRTMALATRYYSSTDCAPEPKNQDQLVSLVEYIGVDVDETITRLKLTCPVAQVRSNSAPHRDGQEASPCGQLSPAPARGRER